MIANGITDDKSSITNVPVGTRFEEIDTRKIYTRQVQPGGASTGNIWAERGETLSSALRGIFGGGQENTSIMKYIDYFTIQTLGDAADFCDLTVDGRGFFAAFADSTRGVFAGGASTTWTNIIDYITVATTGNATDFGDTYTRQECAGCADATRGCMFGGTTASGGNYSSTIDYVTILTTGNATSFGNMTSDRAALGCMSDATRGIEGGGFVNYATQSNIIEYITIQSTGNSADFGDLGGANYTICGTADATRGIFAGGNGQSAYGGITNVIQYITIQSTGNATDFGDLSIAKQNCAACADATRAVIGGGYNAGEGAHQNVMEYVTIQTTGNATDFGDMTDDYNNRGGLAA